MIHVSIYSFAHKPNFALSVFGKFATVIFRTYSRNDRMSMRVCSYAGFIGVKEYNAIRSFWNFVMITSLTYLSELNKPERLLLFIRFILIHKCFRVIILFEMTNIKTNVFKMYLSLKT